MLRLTILALVCAAALSAETRSLSDTASKPIELKAPAGAEQNGHQSDICLWVAFVGLFIPALYMGFSSFQQPDGKRYFHIISFLINAIASIAYLAMANGFGSVYVFGSNGTYRQFWYARYIDWSLTTPLQLLDLAGLGGASMDTTLWLLATDFLMIISGLIGGLIGSQDNACWGFFVFGMMAYIPIIYSLMFGLPVEGTDPAAVAVYKKAAGLTSFFWTMYPVVWILAEGTSTITSDQETILYTFLDIIAKSVFGIIIVCARDGISAATSTPAATSKGDQLM
jgi:bacteriorhodopsin